MQVRFEVSSFCHLLISWLVELMDEAEVSGVWVCCCSARDHSRSTAKKTGDVTPNFAAVVGREFTAGAGAGL